MARFTLDHRPVPPTPFYYYDLELLRDTLTRVRAQADRYGYHVHYAMKANVEPAVLQQIRAYGLGADCVSGYEVRCAIEQGFAPGSIVFAGVGKSDPEIEYAIDHDIYAFNCESLQELEVINHLAAGRGKVVRIALRINPDIQPDQTHQYTATGQADSKFGISYREVGEALARIDSLANISISGIHFHIGSQIGNMDSFRKLALRVNEIAAWFTERGVRLDHLNLGGGLAIDYTAPDQHPIPDFEAYFALFHEHLQVPENQSVHFELGRSIVGQCGELVTRVLYTKTTANGAHFAITDAGMTELIRPALYGAHHQIENLTAVQQGRPADETYSIAGPICESSDIFARNITFPHTERGDLLALRSTGAYGSIMSSNYNMRPTAPAYFSE